MVFVRKARTAYGATAVQIAERRAGSEKVFEHLGPTQGEAEFAALLEPARARIFGAGGLALARILEPARVPPRA